MVLALPVCVLVLFMASVAVFVWYGVSMCAYMLVCAAVVLASEEVECTAGVVA